MTQKDEEIIEKVIPEEIRKDWNECNHKWKRMIGLDDKPHPFKIKCQRCGLESSYTEQEENKRLGL